MKKQEKRIEVYVKSMCETSDIVPNPKVTCLLFEVVVELDSVDVPQDFFDKRLTLNDLVKLAKKAKDKEDDKCHFLK